MDKEVFNMVNSAVNFIPYDEGSFKELSFLDMDFTRNSLAWSPDNGRRHGIDQARFCHPEMFLTPRYVLPNFYSFDKNIGHTAYDHLHIDPCYYPPETTQTFRDLIENLERKTKLEPIYLSHSFEGREIYGYRLGSADKKHFVCTCAVHGDEIDGLPGAFKAFEILATDPFFAPFREEWTLFFVPAVNPDGIVNFTRLTSHLQLSTDGVNYVGINANRVFDWFWAEYNPGTSESKGSFAEQPGEVTGLLKYWRTGCRGNPVDFKFLFDMHSTAGDGARYQSRDRTWLGQEAYDYRWTYADVLIYNQQAASQRKRVILDGDPELYVRYYRSRKNPHLHPWFGTRPHPLHCVSMVCEENKIKSARSTLYRTETYSGACNYRLDYLLNAAMAMTEGSFEKKSAVLVEGVPTQNICKNSNFKDWQPDELRPGYWTPTRATASKERTRFLEANGPAIKVQPELEINLPDIYEGAVAANVANTNKNIVIVHNYLNIDRIEASASGAFTNERVNTSIPAGSPVLFSMMFMSTEADTVIVASGMSDLVTQTKTVFKISDCSDTCVFTQLNDAPENIMYSAWCDNSLGISSRADVRGFSIGGCSDTSVTTPLNKIYKYDPATDTWASSSFIDLRDSSATYHPATGKIYVFGGASSISGGSVPNFAVYEIDPDTLTYSTVVLDAPASWSASNLLGHCSLHDYRTENIVIYCGVGRSLIYSFNPDTGEILELTIKTGLDGGEDAHASEEEEQPIWDKNWYGMVGTYIRVIEADSELSGVLIGGKINYTNKVPELTTDIFIHDFTDSILATAETFSYGYLRYNYAIEAINPSNYTDVGYFSPNTSEGESDWTFHSLVHDSIFVSASEMTLYNVQELRFELRDYKFIFDYSGRLKVYRLEGYSYVLLQSSIKCDIRDNLKIIVSGSYPVRLAVSGQSISGIQTNYYYDDFSEYRGLPGSFERIIISWEQDPNDDEEGGSYSLALYDLELGESLAGCGIMSMSSLMRSDASNISGYNRLTMNIKDDVVAVDSITRRVRNYYSMAPINNNHEYRASVDLSEGLTSTLEDGFRAYMRFYTHHQKNTVENIMVNTGGPKTWHPKEAGIRAAEKVVFANAITNYSSFYVEFDWLPIGDFGTLESDEVELLKISRGTTSGITLSAVRGSKTRMYNLNDSYGQHNPCLRLTRTRYSNSTFVDVPVYWGMMTVRDTAHERYDLTLRISIIHIDNKWLELRVEKAGCIGSAFISEDELTKLGNSASIDILGGGYWAAPKIRHTVKDSRGVLIDPLNTLYRATLNHDLYGAILAGEMDPSNGYIDWRALFYSYESFNRSDNTNLGSHWDVLIQSGNGWDIENNKAKCTTYGLERWDANPGLLNCGMKAVIAVDDVGSNIGIVLHLDSSDAYSKRVYGYSVELAPISGTEATIKIYRLWYDHNGVDVSTGTNIKVELITATIPYVLGEFVDAVFNYDSTAVNNLNATVDGTLIIANDEAITKCGKLGIYGETSSSAEAVWIDRIEMHTPEKISLTDDGKNEPV